LLKVKLEQLQEKERGFK